MAKYEEKTALDLDSEEAFSEFDDLAEDDYVFIVGADGKLKNVILPPEESFEYSEQLLKVFDILGISDPDMLSANHTIH